MRRRRRRRQALFAFASVVSTAQAAAPMSYLTSHGARGLLILPLTRGVLAIAIVVAATFAILTVVGIWRRGARAAEAIAVPPHRRDASLWLYVGMPVSLLLLLVAMVWTVVVLHRIAAVPPQASLTIEVTGRQWWWQVRYLDGDPWRIVSTANEIHIPVGQPVRVKLVSADVIHSFWVPALSGKTDAIPGQTNIVWLQADEPGRYRGQCSEYCGVQHAHMALEVVAEAPDAFKRWYAAQLEPAATLVADNAAHGAQTFEYRCGVCHTVRGTRAGGTSGPDLTHLMARGSIAAVTVPNSAGMLAAWMANPQAIKPGNRMPVLQLSPDELAQLDAFLVTLK